MLRQTHMLWTFSNINFYLYFLKLCYTLSRQKNTRHEIIFLKLVYFSCYASSIADKLCSTGHFDLDQEHTPTHTFLLRAEP